ncbi:MAG: ribose-5-phosphate isomerase RpiA [Pseudomonadota bacterium]
MSPEEKKQLAAKRAMEFIEPGMVIGLGTGSTTAKFIDLLGSRVKEGFEILCIPTSQATHHQAEALGIPLTMLDENPFPNLVVDGADELDDQLRLIKGGGGALLREKIVAAACDGMIVIADDSKHVQTLGRFPLPVEVDPFGLETTRRTIAAIAQEFGLNSDIVLRRTDQGQPFKTDSDNFILDCAFSELPEPEALAIILNEIPGVVEHGLFIGLADIAIIAGDDGVKILEFSEDDDSSA